MEWKRANGKFKFKVEIKIGIETETFSFRNYVSASDFNVVSFVKFSFIALDQWIT